MKNSVDVSGMEFTLQLPEGITNAKTSDPDGVKTTSDLSPQTSGDYYTLDGQRLEKKPAKKGLYMHNGKKCGGEINHCPFYSHNLL